MEKILSWLSPERRKRVGKNVVLGGDAATNILANRTSGDLLPRKVPSFRTHRKSIPR